MRWPLPDKQDAKRDAESSGEQPGTESAEAGGNQHRRNEDEEGAAIPQPRVQSPGQHEPMTTTAAAAQ